MNLLCVDERFITWNWKRYFETWSSNAKVWSQHFKLKVVQIPRLGIFNYDHDVEILLSIIKAGLSPLLKMSTTISFQNVGDNVMWVTLWWWLWNVDGRIIMLMTFTMLKNRSSAFQRCHQHPSRTMAWPIKSYTANDFKITEFNFRANSSF